MKILFYTRFENNTGGDETLLNILQFYLLEHLKEDEEVHLCISYDESSKERAQRAQYKWYAMLLQRALHGHAWLFFTTENSLEKSIPGVIYRFLDIGKIQIETFNAVSALDPKITWYLKSSDRFYIFKKGSIEKEYLPPLFETPNALQLPFHSKVCHIGCEKTNDPSHYPLYVLRPDTIEYYASQHAIPQIFSCNSAPKKQIQHFFEKIGRNKGQPAKLSNEELKTITSFTYYLPNELLMSPQEERFLEDFYLLPKKIKREKKTWTNFLHLTQSLDLFIVAGWANLQNRITAKYLKDTLNIDRSCKVLLTCAPGMSIDAYGFYSGLKEQGYVNLYTFQPGIGAEGGFPILPSLKQQDLDHPDARQAWLNHIASCHLDKCIAQEGQPRKDKIIVIYTSKDGPGLSGTKFLQDLSTQIVPADYPVLLIGADTNSNNYKLWEKQCKLRGFQSCQVIKRTEHSHVLMRGLRDAEFSMATGAFSILEARYLGITHCKYLCPPHMIQLGTMLAEADESTIQRTFISGQASLKKLGLFITSNENGDSFKPTSAWRRTDSSEWRSAWQKYLMETKDKLELQNALTHTNDLIDEEEKEDLFLSAKK
ncbi:MAG: hypothetical protein H2069_07795 [Legionella sp.]|nr:hypothetical protein [Legionella sp.]